MFQEWRGQTLGRLINYSVRQWPDNVALRGPDGETTTYEQLGNRIATLVRGLRNEGVGPGDHIGYLLAADESWVEVFFAISVIGATAVPLNLQWTSTELGAGLALTDVTVLVVAETFRGVDLLSRVKEAIPDLQLQANGKAKSDVAKVLRRVLVSGPETHKESLTLAQIRERGAGTRRAPDEQEQPLSPALLLLTSGSTSFAKAAIHTHQSLLAGIASYADGMEITSSDRLLHMTPNYHVGGLISLVAPLMRGAAVCLMGAFQSGEAIRRIRDDRITLLWGFDTHFSMMRADSTYSAFDASSVSRTMIAGNPSANQKILEMGIQHVGSLYGSTEYMGSQSYFPYRDRLDQKRMIESSGRATSGEIVILEPKTNQILPPTEYGEICVRGPALFAGYYGMLEESRACVDSNGYFHSGDRGYIDDEGYLYFRGRYTDVIKTGGENVSATEVEQVLGRLEGVLQVRVLGIPDPMWGESVTAAIELAEGFVPNPQRLRKLAREELSGFKLPKHFFFFGTGQWPITPTGKTDSRAIRRALQEELNLQESEQA